MSASFRLVASSVLTVLCALCATTLVPDTLAAQVSQTVQTAQTARVGDSARAAVVAASHPRAVSAPPIVWTRAVATRALVRGDTLQADDFAVADTAIHGRIPFGLDTTTPQAGWLIRRAVAAGEWLRAPAVQPRAAVSAGQSVQALWFDGDVSLSVTAIALNSAPIGGAVSLRVGRTRRLRGVAMAPDTVRIR